MNTIYLYFILLPSFLISQTQIIAISYFDNTSEIKEYNALSKGLADMLITDLSNIETLQIVEREKLESIIQEIELGEQGYINPNTAQKIGNGLGAEYILRWLPIGTHEWNKFVKVCGVYFYKSETLN